MTTSFMHPDHMLVRMGEDEEYSVIVKEEFMKRYETLPEFEDFSKHKTEEIQTKIKQEKRTTAYDTFNGPWILIGWKIKHENETTYTWNRSFKNAILVHCNGFDAFTGEQLNFFDPEDEFKVNQKLWKNVVRFAVNREALTYPSLKPTGHSELFNATAMKNDFKLRFDGDQSVSQAQYMTSSIFMSQFWWFAELADPHCTSTLRSFIGVPPDSKKLVSDRALKSYFDILHGAEEGIDLIVHRDDYAECNHISQVLGRKKILIKYMKETLPLKIYLMGFEINETTIEQIMDPKSDKFFGEDTGITGWMKMLNSLFDYINKQQDPAMFGKELLTKEKCKFWKFMEAQMPKPLWRYCTSKGKGKGLIPNSLDIVQLFISKHCL